MSFWNSIKALFNPEEYVVDNGDGSASVDLFGKTYTAYPDGSHTSAETSANDVTDNPATDELYVANREWAEEQAQGQMDFQTSANKIAMDFSSAEADKARAWEAEMANTAYQRAVKDLKAAGLNPILAYSQGGAAVPSVSAAQGVTSAGAKADMADTGYKSRELELQELKIYMSLLENAISSASSIISSAIGRNKTVTHYKS